MILFNLKYNTMFTKLLQVTKVYFLLIVFLICSCSQYKPLSCPDFKKDKNYSEVKKDYPKYKKQFRTKKKSNLLTLNSKKGLFTNKDKKNATAYERSLNIPEIEKQNDQYNHEKSLLINSGNENETTSITSNKKKSILISENNEKNLNKEKKKIKQINIPFNNHSPGNKVSHKDLKKQFKEIVHTDNRHNNFGAQQKTREAEGFAIASLVLGILGLFIFGIPFGILAVIFSSIALSRISANPGLRGRGMAVAGMVLGIIDIIGAFIAIAVLM